MQARVTERCVRACVDQLRLTKFFPNPNDLGVIRAVGKEILDAATQSGIDDAGLSKMVTSFIRTHEQWPGIAKLTQAINPPKSKQPQSDSAYWASRVFAGRFPGSHFARRRLIQCL